MTTTTAAQESPPAAKTPEVKTVSEVKNGFAELSRRFLERLRAVRQLSPHTVAAYRRDLRLLARESEGRQPPEIDAAMLRAIIARQTEAGAHPATVARRLAAWRMFFDFLRAEGKLRANAARRVRAPKKPPRLPRALTPEQTEHLLAAPPPADAFLAARDSAMFELLYSSALRAGELVAMDTRDLDEGCRLATVRRGKGGEGRVVPIGFAARKALRHWLTVRAGVAAAGEPALFLGARGRRLGARALQNRLSAQALRAGTGMRVSPHVLRHSCASHFLQSSGDLRATQEMLGHKDIAATQIYARLDFQNLAQTYDRAHPRARKQNKPADGDG